MPMLDELLTRLLRGSWSTVERVQELWSGYGEILRCAPREARDGAPASLIVKHVRPPQEPGAHPRAWGSARGHRRKLESYRVEQRFYSDYAPRTDARCRVPEAHELFFENGAWVFVLEDLDAAGFAERRRDARDQDVRACLAWLASFHARFLRVVPDGLWPTGCYWHLATRPDELEAMKDGELRAKASAIDERLASARFQTLVHGDAKLANFCFGATRPGATPQVAAVDFQYVGGGCGIKDVAYFLSSCYFEDELEARADTCLNFYFDALRRAVEREGADVAVVRALCAEWRELYAFAWADFYRFLLGWAPTHAKVHGYSAEMTERALRVLRRS